MTTRDDQQMNVRVDRELYDDLHAIAKREDRNLAQTIRFALKTYVADWKAKHDA